MQDWTTRRLRYLIHLNDGGSGMRMRDEPLQAGCEWTTARIVTASWASSSSRCW
jgi:hypothetical protein